MDDAAQSAAEGGRVEVPCSFGDEFAAAFAASAETLLATRVQVRTCRAGSQSAGEFLASLEEPSCCYLLGRAAGAAAVCFSPEIAFPMIDRLLGGPGERTYVPVRPLSAVERRMLGRIAQLAGESLSAVWPGGAGGRFDAGAGEFLARDLAAGDADRQVVVVAAALSLGPHVGAMRVCFEGRLAERAADSHRGGPLELSVSLAAEIDPDELAGLSAGDVVLTDSPADGEVIVRVAGIPKYAGRLASADGRRAVTITRRLDAPAPGGGDA